MVKVSDIQDFIRQTYSESLGEHIAFLAIGGSLGRGNYIDGWSDADLLLVLSYINSDILCLVKNCEKKIFDRFHIDVDTMITNKHTLEQTPAEKLHGKIKNFLFFISNATILIRQNINLPTINYSMFVYGFWSTYADQEKNYLRRNSDIDFNNRESVEKLFKKNIKIIFLLLKQCFATSELTPCTYDEVLILVSRELSPKICFKLEGYVKIRQKNSIHSLSDEDLRRETRESLDIFQSISRIMVQHLSI